jgi:hypothetical protein
MTPKTRSRFETLVIALAAACVVAMKLRGWM